MLIHPSYAISGLNLGYLSLVNVLDLCQDRLASIEMLRSKECKGTIKQFSRISLHPGDGLSTILQLGIDANKPDSST